MRRHRTHGPDQTSALAHYWRRVPPPRLSVQLRRAVTDAAVPRPPADPAPDQVLAFACLHTLATAATDHCLASHRPVTAAHPDLRTLRAALAAADHPVMARYWPPRAWLRAGSAADGPPGPR